MILNLLISMKKQFRFEVWKDGRCLMSTNYPECVYDKETRASMRKRGYILYKNGKEWKAKKKGEDKE